MPDDATLPPATYLGPVADALTLPPTPVAPAPGTTTEVPGYEIVRVLGRGGMGVVYEARQISLNRTVALKMVLTGGHASAADLDRFRTEAEAVARLLHPNIVQIYETGAHAGLPYFSLEFCPGGSLDRKLDGTPWEPQRAAALVEALARAMHAAHEAGVIHRDLKPANILLAADGTPKVTDFGLAKRLDSAAGPTQSGAILGTPSYMAPEQAGGGQAIGPAADTYALGAILYELLTGRPPFKAATPLDTVLFVVSDDPVPPTRLNPKMARDLETVALKCLAKDPTKRYATAAALADDLRRFQAGEPITARPAGVVEMGVKWAKRRPAVAALSAAVVLALAGGFAGVLYELQIANEARTRAEAQEQAATVARGQAETQEALATQRADELAKQHQRIRRELHQSDLLRVDLLLQSKDFARAEELLWRSHFTRPDDDDRRAYWNLWELYRQRPRRAGSVKLAGMPFWSPDGRRVALIDGSHVTIHDAATGTLQTELTTPQSFVMNAVFSRDGARLGLASRADGSITVWDLDPRPTLRMTHRPTVPTKPDPTLALGGTMLGKSPDEMRQIQEMAFFSQVRMCFLDGDRVLVTEPGSAILLRLDSPAVVLSRLDLEAVSGIGATYSAGAFLPSVTNGDIIAVLRAAAVQLWEMPRTSGASITRTQLDFSDPAGFRRATVVNGRPVVSNPVFGGNLDKSITGVALSPDGKWLITRSNRHLRIWDAVSGEKRGDVEDDGFAIPAVTPDGTTLRSINTHEIRLWRMPDLEAIRAIPYLGGGAFSAAALSADGRQTYMLGGGIVAVYDHQPPDAIRAFPPPDVSGWSAARTDLGPVGPVIGLDSKINGIAVWGDDRVAPIGMPWQLRLMPETSLALARSGTAAVSWRNDMLLGVSVTLYDLVTRRVVRSFPLREPERGLVRMPGRFRLAPDGRTLAVETERGPFLMDLAEAKVLPIPHDQAAPVVEGYTPDSRALLLQGHGELILINLADSRVLARQKVSPAEGFIDFSADGKLLAMTADRHLVLRNGATLGQVGEIPATVDQLHNGAVSQDGQVIATGGPDGKLRLFDVRRREELIALDLGAGAIRKVVFTPDGAKVRFIAEKQVGEIDLHAYDAYVEGNLTWNLLRLLPELDRAEAEGVLDRLRDSHPEAYRAGRGLITKSSAK